MYKKIAIVLIIALLACQPCFATKVTSSQTNLTAGEFSPFLLGRIDIGKYANGAKKIENFLIHNAGGAIRRPGSKYVAEVKDSTKETRIIDFQFSTDQAYILEIGDQYIRFFTDQGQLDTTTMAITGVTKADPAVVTSANHPFQDGDSVTMSGVVGMTDLNGNDYTVANRTATTYELTGIDSSAYGVYTSGGIATRAGPTEIPTDFLEAELFDIQYAQSADIMYLVHPNHPPVKLSRLSATSWTITDVDFTRGPFLDDNITATTLNPSVATGTGITITASTDTFNANHVDSFWRIKDGYVKITAYASATSVTADVQAEPDGTAGNLGGTAAVDDWAEGAWSDDEGFPASVTFHEQRLALAATSNNPQTVWASVSQSFENFEAGANAADAFIYKIATEQVNAIRWMSSGPKALQVGTSGGTFSFSSGSISAPITPTSIVVSRDTTYGVASVLPKRIGNFVYFVQRNLKVLRELGYDFDIDSQAAINMTLLADHVAGDGIVDMAYQQSPNDTLWCVRTDGQIATLTRQIAQEVIGWSRQISGTDTRGAGSYESVAVVPIDGGDDEVWTVVKRYIDGAFVRYIEFFMPREFEDQQDAFFVDSGLSLDSPLTITAATKADPVVITATSHGFANGDQIKIVDVDGMTELNNNFYLVSEKTDHTFELTDLSGNDIDGTAYTTYITDGEAREMVTTVSGLGHLEGATVAVAADGGVQPNAVVASGAVTIQSKASVIHVGLPYTPILELLPLTDGSVKGTGAAAIRRIYKAFIRFNRTLGAEFGTEDEQDPIYFAVGGTPRNQAPPLFTGISEVDFPLGYSREGSAYITQPQPLPITILYIILLSDVSEE